MPELRPYLRPYEEPRQWVSRTTPLVERLASAIDYQGPDHCWEWRAACDSGGYGSVKVQGHTRKVHIVVYELLVGPIPAGLVLDHTCHNGSGCAGGATCPHHRCCNPAHLEPVTNRENILRGVGLASQQVLRTHCPRGHPYDEANTYVLPSRPTARYCRTCTNDRKRRRRAAAR